MSRLNSATLKTLAPTIERPAYPYENAGIGIVHLGMGAFHRAHQAWYTERVMNASGGDWAIAGASLRSPSTRDLLQAQDYLYSLVISENEDVSVQVIGAVRDVLVAPEDPQRLVDLMAAETTRVISLTVTEKGYCHNPGIGDLDMGHLGIQRDIDLFPRDPGTAIGLLVAALAQRKSQQGAPVTVMSCDNLPHNGQLLKRVVLQFAQAVDASLALWIENHATFPCTMVDRIVPATTDDDIEQLQRTHGYEDRAAVFSEPFSQWVIEDNFAGPVPDWASVGALYVDDVAPFEDMKLRLLNGSHSIIAYLGNLAGYDYVHQVMANPDFNRLIRTYLSEVVPPALDMPQGFELADYVESLLQRFANRALNHKTRQIAMDGSQKIPQRWLRGFEELMAQGKPMDLPALALAGWVRYLEGARDNGDTYTIDDPLAEQLTGLVQQARAEGQNPVAAVMGFKPVFGDMAAQAPEFVALTEKVYRQLAETGVNAWLSAWAESAGS